MKNFVVFVVVIFGMFPVGGCSNGKKATADARPAAADGGDAASDRIAVDIASSTDQAVPIDGPVPDRFVTGSDVAIPDLSRSESDAYLVDLAAKPDIASFDVADESADVALLTDATIAPVKPALGHYSARFDGPETSNFRIYPLNEEGFTVHQEASTGTYWIVFTFNRKRYGDIPIVNGEFQAQYGDTQWGADNCPDYGYIIKGSFVSSTEARGEITTYQKCGQWGYGAFIANRDEEAVVDSGIVDTAPFIHNIGLDAMPPDLPPIYQPVPGRYAARLVPDGSDAGTNSISRLDAIGLTVRVDPDTGIVTIFFFSAMDTDGIIPVTDGTFNHIHGKGGTDGTTCPANGYAINGAFVSPTEIEGDFVSTFFCSYMNSGHYIATLVPEPDSGVAPDTATAFEAGAIDH